MVIGSRPPKRSTRRLKELGYQHKKAHPGTTPANGLLSPHPHAKMHEPQGNSDAQMREALQILQGALTHFNGTHPKAVANVKRDCRSIRPWQSNRLCKWGPPLLPPKRRCGKRSDVGCHVSLGRSTVFWTRFAH